MILNERFVVVFQSFNRVQLFAAHGLQHARLPCPSVSPGVCSNSYPLSQWCHPSCPMSPPSPSAFNLSQHRDLFQWVCSSHQVAKCKMPVSNSSSESKSLYRLPGNHHFDRHSSVSYMPERLRSPEWSPLAQKVSKIGKTLCCESQSPRLL